MLKIVNRTQNMSKTVLNKFWALWGTRSFSNSAPLLKEAKQPAEKCAKKGRRLKTFHIYRYTQESKKKPYMQKYTIDINEYRNCEIIILY